MDRLTALQDELPGVKRWGIPSKQQVLLEAVIAFDSLASETNEQSESLSYEKEACGGGGSQAILQVTLVETEHHRAVKNDCVEFKFASWTGAAQADHGVKRPKLLHRRREGRDGRRGPRSDNACFHEVRRLLDRARVSWSFGSRPLLLTRQGSRRQMHDLKDQLSKDKDRQRAGMLAKVPYLT